MTDDNFRATIRHYLAAVDDPLAAARNLKPFACGEELYFERFPQATRLWTQAEPRHHKRSCYFEHMTPEAAAKWLDTVRREIIFQKLRNDVDRMTGRDDVELALGKIDPDCERRKWFTIGAALKHAYGEAGWPLWRDWSARGRKFPGDGELRYQWDSIRNDHDKPATLGSIFFHAKEADRA
jgi:hypothetical protein